MSEITELSGWVLYERAEPNAILQQGDLVAFETDNPLQKYGIVVTADCDLEKRKHARLVTMVSVVHVADYVQNCLLLELCDRNLSQISAFVTRKFGVIGDVTSPENVAELRIALEGLEGVESRRVDCLAAKLVLHEVDQMTPDQFRGVMTAVGVGALNLEQKLASQIRQKGDVLILPSLRAIGIESDLAWVRHVWQVPTRSIVIRGSEVGHMKGQRVARLDSPYRYRLTQMLGQVFSDVGLPDRVRDFGADFRALLG